MLQLLVQKVAIGVTFTLTEAVLFVELLVEGVQLDAVRVVLRLHRLHPVGHLLVQFLQGAELEVVALLHVLADDGLLLRLLLTRLFLHLLSVEHTLLLRQVADEGFTVHLAQQAQKVVHLVQDQQLYVWLHPDAVDESLLFLDQFVLVVPAHFLNLGHVDALLCLLDSLLCKGKHLLQGLNTEDQLWWFHLLGLLGL